MKVLKNKAFIIIAVITFILLAIIFNTISEPHKRQLQAKEGILDLAN